MRWPWQRNSERREAQPFTDAVVAAIQSTAAGGDTGNPAAIAALEFCASAYANAFAAARIEPDVPALTPAVRALIARNLIRRGEDMHLIEVRGGAIRLLPVGSWDVRGGDDPDLWFVRADLFGPSGNRTVFRPHSAFVHCRYAVDPARSWYGIPPLGWARSTGTLAGNLETRLAQEAGGPSGYVLPVPQDGGDGGDEDPLADFKSDMARAAGKTMLAETTAAAWGEGKTAAPTRDYVPSRFGANPPDVLRALRSDASLSILGACGVPVSLATDADGTSQREAWRRFVMGAVEPLAAVLATEIAEKLDVPVAFDFGPLWAHDLQGRASSFKALATGGMDVSEAARLSGVLADG